MEARHGVKQAAVIAGLFLFCTATLIAPAFLMDWRLSHRAGETDGAGREPAARAVPEAVGTAGRAPAPALAIVRGTRDSLADTVRALQDGRRTAAAESLDAARRVARAASTGLSGEWGSTFGQVLRAIERSRRLLQNGRAAEAPAALQPAVRLLDALYGSAGSMALPSNDLSAAGRYRGASVVDARGRVIGELTGFEGSGDARHGVIRLGGWPDILGIVDLGGRSATIPTRNLVFGEAGTLRETVVAAAALPEQQ